jgi:predicted RecB family nuclease
MQKIGESYQLSGSDLVGHLNCRYLTRLDREVARGTHAKPAGWDDPMLEVLAQRGALHEDAFVKHLTDNGLAVTRIEGKGIDKNSTAETLHAMREGVPIIVQAALGASPWSGRADILRRIEQPSALGAWSYEVLDTKLARETKGNTVLQLCLYSDLLRQAQAHAPEFAYVVTPGTGFQPEAYRLADYLAYYRRIKTSLETAVANQVDIEAYPEPIEHCEICRWRTHCDAKRHQDDHPSLIAGVSKLQSAEFERRGATTLSAIAKIPLPLPWKPDRGAVASYERVREQARIQAAGRTAGKVIYEALDAVPDLGLFKLPVPSNGDIFLDLEGDPFVDEGGLEYLFGYAFLADDGTMAYRGHWALSRTEEKTAFERFIDFAIARQKEFPDLHIYHFAPYEPAALKRLMGRYVTRENEVDQLLRGKAFVDLYAVVRHSIRASVESYSIKRLEPLYAFERSVPLADSGRVLARVQAALETDDIDSITADDRAAAEGYNRDDCLSAWGLRDWLEGVRAQLIESGIYIARPATGEAEASPDVSAWQEKVGALVARLIEGIPDEPEERSGEQQARWLLAHTLDWHRREDKAAWWEYFRLSDLSVGDLLEERSALSGLVFVEAVGGTDKAPVHRYRFPPQEADIRGREDLRSLGGAKFGKIESISLDDRIVDVKKRKDTATFHPGAVFAHDLISTKVLAEALVRLGEYVATHGITGDGPLQAARDLLMVAAPRVGGQPLRMREETPLAAATRLAGALEGGVFPIQGPPGAGKTHIGARMICTLAASGKTVGITANSHKVIRNLLDETLEAAAEQSLKIQCVQKVSEEEPDIDGLSFVTQNDDALSAIGNTCHVAAGTAWLWADADAEDAVDFLVIDEAAQMSLANTLAVSQAAKTIILLGDPRQLEQPIKGTHPDGVDASALDHILGEHKTIPPDRGLFLEETWRLHPDICAFTSELFYEGRLFAHDGLQNQRIVSRGPASGSGLRFFPVVHQGNQSSSPEEADAIRDLVSGILGVGGTWIDRDEEEAPLTLSDILIIAPYNAQVFELQQRISGARIGTVDKFQGQEAPVVIYSMTTSSAADAPRGMEFLFSPNRMNVATSRSKCVCILVGSPTLFEAECRTPRQMQLANAFCRYLEMAAPRTTC